LDSKKLMKQPELKRVVEALIFAADAPLSPERIRETLPDELNGFDLNGIIDDLNRDYSESGRAFFIRQIAGGYQVTTRPELHNWVKKLFLGRNKMRLSQAALETLAIVAFKQPISRVDIAQIRGVNSDAVIGTLLEKKLVVISGRSEGVGRPLLYNTTPEFLQYFGVNDLADLPKPREIEELIGKEGMPEEVLHALSDEKQLELPINAEAQGEGEESVSTLLPPVILGEKSEDAVAATIPEETAPAEGAAGQNEFLPESENPTALVEASEAEELLEEEVDAIVVEDPDATESDAAGEEGDSPENDEAVQSASPATGFADENETAIAGAEDRFLHKDESALPAVLSPKSVSAPEAALPEPAEETFVEDRQNPARQPRKRRKKRAHHEAAPEQEDMAGGSAGEVSPQLPPEVSVVSLAEIGKPALVPSEEHVVPPPEPERELVAEQSRSDQPTIVEMEDVARALSDDGYSSGRTNNQRLSFRRQSCPPGPGRRCKPACAHCRV
jgi:segregation and condensation protein B